MPSKNRTVISIRGTEEYEAFLRELLAHVHSVHPHVTNFHRLGEYAIEFLAWYYQLKAVPHAGKRGPRRKQAS